MKTILKNSPYTHEAVISPGIVKYGRLWAILDGTIEAKALECNMSKRKRFFDLALSALLFLFIFSWLFPLIALCIKLNSKGPVFFIQERTGLNGKPFRVYKFRSMAYNAPEADHSGKFMQAIKNDSRVTSIGAFLRKTSLDELPQFINVLKGEMSLVGPRPHVKVLDNRFDYFEDYELRMLVKPGITGLAQATGLRGATTSDYDMELRVRADVAYIRNWSIGLDIKIIILTFLSVFKGVNAY